MASSLVEDNACHSIVRFKVYFDVVVMDKDWAIALESSSDLLVVGFYHIKSAY